MMNPIIWEHDQQSGGKEVRPDEDAGASDGSGDSGENPSYNP